MKKIALLIIAAAAVTVLSAQQTNTNTNKRRNQNSEQQDRQFDPKAAAERRTEQLSKELNLTDAQKEKVNALYLEQINNSPRPDRNSGERPSEAEMTKMREQMQQNRKQFDADMKTILTEEQYTKYQKLESERGQGRGPGQGQGRGQDRGQGGRTDGGQE